MLDLIHNKREQGFTGGSEVKNLPANAGDTRDEGSIPGSGRSPGNSRQGFLPGNIPWAEEPGQHHSKVVVIVWSLNCARLFCDPMDCNPPGSSVHGILQQEYRSGLPVPSPGDRPDPGIEPTSPALAGRFFTTQPPGNLHTKITFSQRNKRYGIYSDGRDDTCQGHLILNFIMKGKTVKQIYYRTLYIAIIHFLSLPCVPFCDYITFLFLFLLARAGSCFLQIRSS